MSGTDDPRRGSLAGLRAVVTGAARGIGRGVAERLAAEGVLLALIDRDGPVTSRLAAELPQPVGGAGAPGHRAFVADLADPAQAAGAVLAAVAAFGGLDAVVNNAGIFEKVALADISIDQWDRMFAVNARAPLVIMQTALPALTASGRGRIVSVASMGARLAAPLEGHYAASKAALMALTRAAAVEWGPLGVTVNAVSPGYVLTEMGAGDRSAAEVAAWTARSPLGRLGRPDDVAGVVAFLLGADAGYLTGQTISVTGGMVMS